MRSWIFSFCGFDPVAQTCSLPLRLKSEFGLSKNPSILLFRSFLNPWHLGFFILHLFFVILLNPFGQRFNWTRPAHFVPQ
jgi:hypothetical protein